MKQLQIDNFHDKLRESRNTTATEGNCYVDKVTEQAIAIITTFVVSALVAGSNRAGGPLVACGITGGVIGLAYWMISGYVCYADYTRAMKIF